MHRSPIVPTVAERSPVSAPAQPMPSGALRAVQPRARATRDALLSAGRALLSERDFDALTIAELAGAIGLSVGSFYGRFRDKESFFALLQQQVTAEWLAIGRALLADARDRGRMADAVLSEVCSSLVAIYRRDSGFIRAALQHVSTHPERWSPIKQTGQRFVEELADCLAPMLGELAPRQRRLRVRFAMQMLFGTCVNAVLNDPGPLSLSDRRLERELARALSMYLGLDQRASARSAGLTPASATSPQ